MRGTVLPLALLVLVLSGCGAARQSAPGTESATVLATVDPSKVATKIVGGTPMQQKALREVLAGIGADVFAEVEIERPATAWGPSPAGSVALVVPHNVDDLRKEWLSWLLAQGFAQRSQELGLPSVSYLAPRRGGVDAESLHSTPRVSEHATLSDARRAAEKARKAVVLNGGEVDRIEILRPHGFAFLVEMRVEDGPAKFLWQGLPKVLGAIGGPEPSEGQYAGDYTIVVDGDGNRLWEGAEAKLGEGSTQVGGIGRGDLAGCSPFFIGGPPPGPPPCPVESPVEPKEASSSLDVTTRIVGATPKQETILRGILAGLGQTVLDEVRVSPADAGWTPSEPNSVVVHIGFTKADKNGRGLWEAQLLAAAFARRSRQLHLQPIAAYETATEGTAIDGPNQQRPERKPITAEELTSKSEAAVKESGARVIELRIVQPQHLALALTLQADNPADYLKHHLMTVLNAIPSLSDREYDGLYLLVVDQKGEYVWFSAQTVSDTISGGSGGVRRDLAGCDPVPSLGSLSNEPPPCPVD